MKKGPRRMIVTGHTPEFEASFLHLMSAIEAMSGCKDAVIEMEGQFSFKPGPVPTAQAQPKVQYRVLAGDDVTFKECLEAVGETTIRGIIYKHLYENGPCSEREVREALTHNRKGVESALDKLKTASLIRPEAYGS